MKAISILLASSMAFSLIGSPNLVVADDSGSSVGEEYSFQEGLALQNENLQTIASDLEQSGGSLVMEDDGIVVNSGEGDVIRLEQSGDVGYQVIVEQVGGEKVDVDPIAYGGNIHADEVRYYIGRPEMKKLLKPEGGPLVSAITTLLSQLGIRGRIISAIIKLIKAGIKAHNWQVKQWIKDTKNVRGIKVITKISGGGPYPKAGVSMHPLKCYMAKGCP